MLFLSLPHYIKGTAGACRGAEDAYEVDGRGELVFANTHVGKFISTAKVLGVKYCEENADEVHGHTYAINMTLDAELIPTKMVGSTG